MQTVTVDGQEALFIPNMGAQANQLNGAQPIQIGNQQAFLTPNGQIIRPGVMPANILQNMGQTVSLPTGKCFAKSFIMVSVSFFVIVGEIVSCVCPAKCSTCYPCIYIYIYI